MYAVEGILVLKPKLQKHFSHKKLDWNKLYDFQVKFQLIQSHLSFHSEVKLVVSRCF